MKTDSDISRIPPNVRSQLEAWASLKGEQVVASDKETKDNSKCRFEVLDEELDDDDGGGGQRKYKPPMLNIIPFPKRNDPSTAQDFPPGRQVLAVYPGTTALYKATVVNNNCKEMFSFPLGLL